MGNQAESTVVGHADNTVAGHADNTVVGHADNTVAGHADNTVAGHADNTVAGHADNTVVSHGTDALGRGRDAGHDLFLGVDKTAERNQPMGLADRLDDVLVKIEDWAVRHRSIAFVVVLAIGIGAGGWWLLHSRSPERPPVEDTIPLAVTDRPPEPSVPSDPDGDGIGSAPAGSTDAVVDPGIGERDGGEEGMQAAPSIVVHVVGAVERPGLVTLAPMSRVGDAVAAAGGQTADAALDRLNLAAPVVDGMQVRVPTLDEPVDRTPDEPLIRLPPPNPASPTDRSTPDQPIDLNAASAELLDTLPGVGPATAAAIVSWRDEHGPFVVVDDLEAVPGIGPVKLANLRDLVTV